MPRFWPVRTVRGPPLGVAPGNAGNGGAMALGPADAGFGRRERPAGLAAGAPLSRVPDPARALGLVAEDLLACETALRQLTHTDVAAIPAVARHLMDGGGKRLRPALTALGARAVGWKGDLPKLMAVGELIHLGSLLHDDVVDDADLRRGRAAAHRAFAPAVTVLSGDFCLARAVWLAAEHGGHAVVTELARAVTEMAEGEVLQLAATGDLNLARAAYYDVIDRKSGALIAWCCAAGALGLGSRDAIGALLRYGRGVGRAFQIADDVLDYVGGAGKDQWADLKERKVTLPLLLAFEQDPSLRERVRNASDGDALTRIGPDIVASGAVARASAAAADFANEAISALDTLPASPYRQALVDLGAALADRAA